MDPNLERWTYEQFVKSKGETKYSILCVCKSRFDALALAEKVGRQALHDGYHDVQFMGMLHTVVLGGNRLLCMSPADKIAGFGFNLVVVDVVGGLDNPLHVCEWLKDVIGTRLLGTGVVMAAASSMEYL